MSSFWFWENGLSEKLCKIIIDEKNNIAPSKALIGQNGILNFEENKKIRDSSLYWLPLNHWLEGILYNYGRYANISTGWNFKITQPENVQITEYDKNGHYDWHVDWTPFTPENLVRKITTVCLLNDPSEFEGGEFELDVNEHEKINIPLKKGSVISFPSFLRHRVSPVTNGIRLSAVCWISGEKTL